MQIVIDIPEEVKHKIYAYGLSLCPSDKEQLIHAIMNGIPLEDIKAEIEAKAKERELYLDMGHPHDGLYEALEIINKHTSGKEQEK